MNGTINTISLVNNMFFWLVKNVNYHSLFIGIDTAFILLFIYSVYSIMTL